MATAAPAVTPAVVDLAQLRAADLALAGGKGANLGELVAAGFPVPGGFCVTTAAYARAAQAAGLDGSTDAAAARAALTAVEVPADVAESVRDAYRALGGGPVAVRSSATSEDLPTASAAGQQDTFLHVVGADAVLDAVRRCWASLWGERAVHYRAHAGAGDAQLAVVVQRMVDAELAGVLFTADPVTGARDRAVIDASPGLGEAVVSGAVDPEHVVVDAAGRVVERRAGDARIVVRPRADGGVEHVPGEDAGARLTDDQARALAALGRRVEEHFGAPQDLEWAIEPSGAAWLVQSRAITTLYPAPPASDELRVWFCVSLAQGLTRPVTPLGMAAFRAVGSVPARVVFGAAVPDPLDGPAALTAIGGRAFVDITPALRSARGREAAAAVLDVMEARTATVLRGLFDRFPVTSRSPLPLVRGALRTAVRFRVPPVVLLALVRPSAALRHVARVGDRLDALTAPPADATPHDRLARVERLVPGVFPVLPRVAPVAAVGLGMLGLAERLAGPDLGDRHALLRSLPHNPTTGMDLDLWALARRVRRDPEATAAARDGAPEELAARYGAGALPAVLQDGLAAFLARYGHRAAAEIDIGVPRWSEDPTPVLAALAGYLRLLDADTDPELAPDRQFARGAREADAAAAEVVARVRRRSRVRAAVVGVALRRARQLSGVRETHKDYLVRLLARARAELLLVGAELAGRGRLDAADDIAFVDLRELRRGLDGADLRDLVAQRRAEHERELRRRHVPRLLLSDGTEPEALVPRTPAPDGALLGSPASAGTATGIARVVLDPATARLEPGEVLVAPSTDPGWTPLFLTAGALVMEMGGTGSHGAVVAREYGIPAVVGVPDATTRIVTGQRVTVDGAAGRVVPHPE